MNGKLKTLALPVAISAVISIAGLGAANPASAAVTIQLAGQTGYSTHYPEQTNTCGNLMGAYVKPIELYLSRTSAYPSQTETIRMFSRIESSSNGSPWASYTQDAVWQERSLRPGETWALFSTRSFSVPRGRYYRVKQFYEWWVNGVRVGTATNLFNQSEYFAPWVAATGTGASYCYIY
jgi:hypothetical protein